MPDVGFECMRCLIFEGTRRVCLCILNASATRIAGFLVSVMWQSAK